MEYARFPFREGLTPAGKSIVECALPVICANPSYGGDGSCFGLLHVKFEAEQAVGVVDDGHRDLHTLEDLAGRSRDWEVAIVDEANFGDG